VLQEVPQVAEVAEVADVAEDAEVERVLLDNASMNSEADADLTSF
jgi:hypothetical protein